MIAPRPQGWVQHGEHWGLWWGNRQIASVQPCSDGIRVTLACRKLWQDKQVRAASIDQGKRFAERWCAARVLEGVPLREAVARLVGHPPTAAAKPKRKRAETSQERRLREALKALPLGDPKLTPHVR
ncbi:hypothetical protein [Tardiphaga sp. P5_C10]